MKTILLIVYLFGASDTVVRIEPATGKYSCQSDAEIALTNAHGMALCFDTVTNQVTYFQARQ